MGGKVKRKSITACTEDGSPVMEIYSIVFDGDKLVLDGKALDSMRMNVVITVDEVAQGFDIYWKKDVFKFAKKLPGAIHRYKKQRKQQAKAEAKEQGQQNSPG